MPLQSIKAPLKLANSLTDRYTTEDRLKHYLDPTVALSDWLPSEQTTQVISAAARSHRPSAVDCGTDAHGAHRPLVVSSPRARTGSLFLIFPSIHELGTKCITRIDLCVG